MFGFMISFFARIKISSVASSPTPVPWPTVSWCLFGRCLADLRHRKMEVLMVKPQENHRKMDVYPLVKVI